MPPLPSPKGMLLPGNGNSAELYLPPLAQNTTGLVALGEELFGQRLLSLQLLGLLLLLAFLVALKLLAEGFRRPQPALQPRLGATTLGGVLLYETFQTPYGGDNYLPLALLLLALAFGALATRRYAFLQCFLLLEGAGLALNLLFTAAAATNESLEVETLVVVAVAVAAAETAVGLGAFLALSQGNNFAGGDAVSVGPTPRGVSGQAQASVRPAKLFPKASILSNQPSAMICTNFTHI